MFISSRYRKYLNMIKKAICFFRGHKKGREVNCPFTLMTYIHCNTCDKTYAMHPIKNDD